MDRHDVIMIITQWKACLYEVMLVVCMLHLYCMCLCVRVCVCACMCVST